MVEGGVLGEGVAVEGEGVVDEKGETISGTLIHSICFSSS